MSFEAEDLEIVDPVEVLRAHPEKYLRRDCLINCAVVGRIMDDIVQVFKGTAFASCIRDWTVIGADKVWLVEDSHTPLRDYFTRFVPLQLAGPNCFHSAIFLGAFASDIAVFSKFGSHEIKGDFPINIFPMSTLPSTCVQCVLFRFEKISAAECPILEASD